MNQTLNLHYTEVAREAEPEFARKEKTASIRTTALVIINPNSRRGAEADITEGLGLLENAGFTLIRVDSKSAAHTTQLINQYHQDIDVVIIGGGDGSVSSAVGAVYRNHLTLAILPLGTANDLARSLGLPTDLLDVFKIIAANKRRKVDLGVFDGHYFFNAAHIGLGGKVTENLTPEIKKRWGVFSYLRAVFAAFKTNRSFRANITIDGTRHRMRSIQLTIGNGRFYGGGNVIDEDATIDDGLLKLYSLPPQSIWTLLSTAPWLRTGKQYRLEHIFTAVGRKIEISTTPSRRVYADGEPVSRTPAVFEIIPQCLNVIYLEPAGPDSTPVLPG